MPRIHAQPPNGAELGETLVLTDERAASQVALVPARGAIVTSFSVRGRELLYLDRSTLTDPTKNVRGGIPLLFPSPGRLMDDVFRYDGRTYGMKQHGFARELAFTTTYLRGDDPSVRLTLSADERTLARYPFPFRFDLTVALRGPCLSLDMRVANSGAGPLPFALGLHPYFLVSDKAKVRIETGARQVFDNVTKSVKPFSGFDLTVPELDYHLLDHGSAESALVLEDGARLVVRASPEFARWVVWTVAGKPYVCLEPWTAGADALNTGEGVITLPPGAAYQGSVEIALAG